MDETGKNFTLEENYYDAFQFSDLSQSGIETENNGNFLNNMIDCPPTIIIDPDESNISNIFISRSENNNHSNSTALFHWDEQLKNSSNSDNDDQNFENEIKSEPIKSELNEVNAANAINSAGIEKTITVSVSATNSVQTNVTRNFNKENSDRPIRCHKCEYCSFISTSEENMIKHKNDIHNTNRIPTGIESNDYKFKCPGCENIHYASKSLENHLEIDHKMLKNEIQILLDSICKRKSNSINTNTKELNKSRIYLKNVEILKNPCYSYYGKDTDHINDDENECGDDGNDENQSISDDLICNLGDHDQTLDNNLTFIDLVGGCNSNSSSSTKKNLSSYKQSQQSNKISIKSVDVLREPSLIHHHHHNHEEQHQFSHYQQDNLIGNTSNNVPLINSEKVYYDLDTGSMNNFQDGEYVVESCSSTSQNQYQTISNNEADTIYTTSVSTATDSQENEKPQRAKIYIKNVDILKEPIFVPSSNNLSNILSVNDDLRLNLLNDTENQRGSSSTTYISPSILTPTIPLVQSLPSISPTSSSFSSSAVSSSTVLDNNSQQFLIKSTDIHHHHHYHRFHHHLPHRNTCVNNRRNKIYIKNVDIINQPCNTQSSLAVSSSDFSNHFPKKIVTTSLHLRTVDELNLMNTNEVQNLITPILDQQNSDNNNCNISSNRQQKSDDGMQSGSMLSDNSKNSDEIQMNSENYNDYEKAEDNMPTDDSYRHLSYANNLQSVWSVEINSQDNGLVADIDSNSSSLISNDQNNPKSITASTPTSISIPILTPTTLTSFELNTPQRPEFISDYDEEVNIDQQNKNIENENQGIDVEEILEQEEEEEDIFFVCAQEIVNQTNEKEEQNNFSNIVTVLEKEGNLQSESSAIVADEQQHEIVEIFDDLEKQKHDVVIVNNTENANNDIIPNENDEKKHKSKRGRPYGAKQTGITKLRKLYGNSISEAEFFKCDMNCALRFRKLETLNYHKKCHISASSLQKQCPECQLNNFSSWNTLHTHLWRCHKIDMELYSCDICNFKTPVQSILVNIHKRIHLNEKNFKCDQCEKTFKNSKQLKNHRRLHRIQKTSQNMGTKSTSLSIDNMKNLEIHKCNQCGSTYAHAKSLKNHVCKNNQFSCSVCNKLITSKSTFKLHILKHKNENLSIQRFKCDNCEYATNDHNSFRRHRMIHSQNPKYTCKFCDYKCIQSNLYQRHLLQKHLDVAHEVLFKCSVCSFTTINQTNYKIHIAKHENSSMIFIENQQEQQQQIFDGYTNLENEDYTEKNQMNLNEDNSSVQLQFVDNLKNYQNDNLCNKIKVKSDLILTDPSKFCSSVSVNTNVKNIYEEEIT